MKRAFKFVKKELQESIESELKCEVISLTTAGNVPIRMIIDDKGNNIPTSYQDYDLIEISQEEADNIWHRNTHIKDLRKKEDIK